MNAPPPPRSPLGETLLQQGLISHDQLHIALREQQPGSPPLGQVLIELGFVSETVLREALSKTLGQESIDLRHTAPDAQALAQIPRERARRLRLLPLAFDPTPPRLLLAMADPGDLPALDQLRPLLPPACHIDTRLASEAELMQAIDQHYGFELSIDGILQELETGEPALTDGYAPPANRSQPVVRLIDALLVDAVRCQASDIHFEPEPGFVRIRYRLDGVLRQIRALHISCWPAMLVRLKVLASLNIAETRAPQDGRFSLTLCGRPLDIRAALLPTRCGENVVLRLLDRHQGLLPLDALGLREEQQALLRQMIARPEGLLLVTGPTGAGKTTTLYSILKELNSQAVNIMTLEDPIEYPLPLLRQTAINEAVKLDFVSGIRALLRQDPDVILVGEIRDRDTAEMAFRAALTGHQVYSTLHTHSALGAIPRLLDLGLPPDILAGNLIGIIAQRLLRRLCPHCRLPYAASDTERRLLGVTPRTPLPPLFRAHGCPLCQHTGYRGRFAVMELLKLDGELDELLARRASRRQLERLAWQKDFRPMLEAATQRAVQGDTSVEEIGRVLDLSQRQILPPP